MAAAPPVLPATHVREIARQQRIARSKARATQEAARKAALMALIKKA